MKIKMKKIAFSSLVLATMVAFSACNSNTSNKSEDTAEVAEEQNEETVADSLEDDTEFAVVAADGGMMEVQLGELAQTNAASADVKKFGKMMVDDHSKANTELKTLAQQKNITLPMALSDEKKKKYDELAAKKGAEFDKAYVDFMVEDHKKDISEFEEAAKDAKDPDVKSWAAGKVPTLKHHLEEVEKIDAKM
jgi:putative membrane protein